MGWEKKGKEEKLFYEVIFQISNKDDMNVQRNEGWYGVQWKQLGTHNKHLSVLDFEKRERQKEGAEMGNREIVGTIMNVGNGDCHALWKTGGNMGWIPV